MAAFKTIVRHQKIAYSPFSSGQMADMGKVMIGVISDRIKRGLNTSDQPARALNPGYAKDKIRHNQDPIRNWMYSGRTMASLKVKTASEDRVTIGFVNAMLGRQISVEQIVQRNNRLVPQWGISPNDEKAKMALVLAMLQQHKVIVKAA